MTDDQTNDGRNGQNSTSSNNEMISDQRPAKRLFNWNNSTTKTSSSRRQIRSNNDRRLTATMSVTNSFKQWPDKRKSVRVLTPAHINVWMRDAVRHAYLNWSGRHGNGDDPYSGWWRFQTEPTTVGTDQTTRECTTERMHSSNASSHAPATTDKMNDFHQSTVNVAVHNEHNYYIILHYRQTGSISMRIGLELVPYTVRPKIIVKCYTVRFYISL